MVRRTCIDDAELEAYRFLPSLCISIIRDYIKGDVNMKRPLLITTMLALLGYGYRIC